MSKFLHHTVLGLCFLFAMVACGGGGGGGSSNPSNPAASSSAPLDSDKDGVPDSSDAFPNDAAETKDTDKDGVGDNADALPNDATETKDSDKDGVGDSKDVFPNDATETKDTDSDGVGDNADAFPNDPSETKDSDKDGVGNNKDVFPNDGTETVDTDKDGVGDNADSTPIGPVIPAWATFQGGATHSGWVDVSLKTDDFKQRWTKTLAKPISRQGAAGDGYVFLNSAGQLSAINAHNGETAWSRVIDNNNSYSIYYQPAYADGIVYVQSGGSNNRFLRAFNALDGSLVFQKPLQSNSDYFSAPVVHDGIVYVATDYYLLSALDAKTGVQKWSQTINQSDQVTPAISDKYVVLYSGNYQPGLTVIDRQSGSVSFTINDPDYQGYGWNQDAVAVVSGDYALTNHSGRLLAFNLQTKQLIWKVQANFIGQPVVKGDRLYVNNNGILEIRTLGDGALVSSITNSNTYPFIGDLLVTNNLLFVRDEKNVYAYKFDGTRAWTLSNKSGGLMLAEGALIINTATEVISFDVDGDMDLDGLPDWWEKRYKKNIDPAGDVDGDGLTALAEFNAFTHPFVADTDGDGLSDGEEKNDYKTSPTKTDTDGDGLNDNQEVKTYKTDPTKVDTDGDLLTDAEEVVASLNPLDSNDALADNDSDGFSNTHELRANTGINDANSHPQATDWSMRGGNSQRSSYSPMLLNSSKFSERWTVSSDQVLSEPVTSGDNLILRISHGQTVGWDAGTGTERWRLPTSTGVYGHLNSHAGKLVYFSNPDVDASFHVLNATSGAKLLSRAVGIHSSNSVPVLSDNTLFTINNDNRSFNAYSVASGDLLWTSGSGNEYYYGGNNYLVGNGQLIAVGSNALNIFATSNGSLVKTISLSDASVSRTMLGSKNNVIIQTSDEKLSSINIADGTRTSFNQGCEGNRIAVGNGRVYQLGRNRLCVFTEQTGALDWSLQLPDHWGSINTVLTASHLFYSDGSFTFGIDLSLKSVTWSIARGASQLALGADGTLYLVNGSGVTAIDTEGDTDADALLQWWERRYGGDLNPATDNDQDGLTNLQEFTAKTNPLVADTDSDGLIDGYEVNTSETKPLVADSDKDGLGDGAEVNTHDTDPLLVDSDKDGVDDAREIALGLDASDGDDATDDNDGDGFSNRDEVYSGTAPNNAASVPVPTDWGMNRAGVSSNGFQPYRLNEDDFSLRWEKSFSLSYASIATGDNHIFVVQSNNYSDENNLLSLNAVDGKQEWKQNLAQVSYLSAPAYSEGHVVVQAASPTVIRRFDADSGIEAASINIGNSFYAYNRSFSLIDKTVYSHESDSIVATQLDTGANLWSAAVRSDSTTTTLNEQYLFYSFNTEIHALARSTGAKAFIIDSHFNSDSNLVLGSRNNILTRTRDLVSYDIDTRRINWRVVDNYQNENVLPVAANGQVLYLSGGALISVDEVNGEQRWSWRPDNQYLHSNIVATLTHIFVANSATTYALSAATGELVWSYAAGGKLALGKNGALYIQSNQQLISINLEGDSDSDGMPDWWERHYGMNINDANDAALDMDADGLTNLEEFTHNTYADRADTDGDALTDAEEINTHSTDPNNSDSDTDGMRDDWELTNSFDPLDAADRDLDTDGDTIPNYFEYLAGTDPNNALSLPAMVGAGIHSFEGTSALPAGWTLSDDTINTGIVGKNASHGTNALQIIGKADISFAGFFAASDLSLDIKGECSHNNIQIYIDDKLIATGRPDMQWSTLKTVIPLGMHKVSIRTDAYYCETYLDKVVIEAAKTNAELGIQFVSMYNGELKFVDANKTLVRTIVASSPATNLTAQAMTTMGNEKVLVAFSGNETRLGVLDLATLNWRYYEGLNALVNSYYSNTNGLLAAHDNFAYVATRNLDNTGSITRVNLTSGVSTQFGSHLYTSLAIDSNGFIHAYSSGVVYKYDPASLALESKSNIVTAQQILVDSDNRLIAVNNNEVVRYNAQRLVEQRLSVESSIRAAAVNGRNELLLTNGNYQTILYSNDWLRSQILAMPAEHLASFPQPDSDNDGLPDWWELAHGLDIANNADAALDSDSDGLTTLEEFGVDTDPLVDDTDGDLLTDGDEVNDFGTNPNLIDTDADGLTDESEVLVHMTNALAMDTDADLVNDYLELTEFLTNPNDTASKPAILTNFTESFEDTFVGWVPSAQAAGGWSVATGVASSGSKSLRADAVDSDQTSEINWFGFFGASTLTFDVIFSNNNCCGALRVYIDDQYNMYINNSSQWQTYSTSLSTGFHRIRFVYSNSSGMTSNTAWIDNIRIQ